MKTQKIMIILMGCFFSASPLFADNHKKCIDGCKQINGLTRDVEACIMKCTDKYLGRS